MNENYQHPAIPDNKTVEEEIIKGIYQLERVEAKKAKANVQLMGSGTILQKVRQAAQILSADYGVSSDVYSVTSFNELIFLTLLLLIKVLPLQQLTMLKIILTKFAVISIPNIVF